MADAGVTRAKDYRWDTAAQRLYAAYQHALEHPIDHRRVIELAVAWRGQAVLARGVQLTWTHLALADRVPLSVWAARYQLTPRDRRALAVYRRRTPYTLKALASLRVIEGTGAKLAFARALALPDRDWLQARGLDLAGPLAAVELDDDRLALRPRRRSWKLALDVPAQQFLQPVLDVCAHGVSP